MRATCWMGKADIQVRQVPDPKILNPDDAIVRITSTAICGSDLHLYNGFIPTMEKGDILGHEFMGEVVEVGREVKKLKVGDRVVVPFPIACGHCMQLRKPALFGLRELQPERLDGREAVGLFARRHLRLLAHAGRLCRRSGGICPRALCRCRADQDPGRHAGRAGAVPVGHLPDRLHGRRKLQHQAGRHHRRLGLRAGRPVRDQERFPAGRRAGDRHRPLPLPAPDGAREGGGRDDQLRGGRQRPGSPEGDDRRARAGRLHRRGRHGSPRHGADRRLRSRQAGDDAGNRPDRSPCARPSCPAATAAPCRSSASMAASWTSSRSARS